MISFPKKVVQLFLIPWLVTAKKIIRKAKLQIIIGIAREKKAKMVRVPLEKATDTVNMT